MDGLDSFDLARDRMVERQLRSRGIADERVLSAMRAVPRHAFVPEDSQHLAYSDAPLPIGERQTISQPYIVALMSELLCLTGDEAVLEIGTGSGYQAAILASLARVVYSLERIPELAERARTSLARLGIENVEVIVGDGTQGFPLCAPFGGIIVTAAAPRVPPPLKDQLAEGARLVLPVGGQGGQVLEVWQRLEDEYRCESIAPVAFVPLIGQHGWDQDERSTSWWF